ncbi:hypothetical protein [Desulforhopalus sp. IMCC35007]|uniref:hypothetical protein n=1 Tax=Desulforhopalus sp. IMCC35007 TaxID=2569543 RepID=UPI0010AEA888|nr:hypothetical protein [Desulforhopalus sp. IMCC35007]TKB08595.1 hypothetical protein FCL48_13070 [Desulforhopalus sp. IMCC35007]
MNPEKRKPPLAFTIALFSILLGGIGLGVSLLIQAVPKGIDELAIGGLLLGAGEYLNHPRLSRQPASSSTQKTTLNLANFLMRRRNVCALGNLLDIAGILMLCIGLGTLLL